MAWKLGHVGHFGLAVRDPKTSAKWWIANIGLAKQFDFPGGVAVGNDAITLVQGPGFAQPRVLVPRSGRLPLGTQRAGRREGKIARQRSRVRTENDPE